MDRQDISGTARRSGHTYTQQSLGINPARAAAVDRYQRDEEFKNAEVDRAAFRRRQIPSAKLLEAVNDAVVHAYRSITENDSTLIAEAASAAGRLAGWFARAVVGMSLSAWLGPTIRSDHASRAEHCDGCSFRKADEMGIFRCAQAARRCVCPQVYWWKPAFLSSQIWFRGFECPIGRFRAHVSYLDVLAIAAALIVFLLLTTI